MAHLIIEEKFNLVYHSLKNKENCFFAEDEILVIVPLEDINIPLTVRPHRKGSTIVRVDNFPMFIDELIIERALRDFADQLDFRIRFENFSKKSLLEGSS